MFSIFLSILSAGLLILAFPKPDLGFLAWFALVPWFFALQREKPWPAFFLSYLVGLVYFSGIVYWVNYVSGLGFTVLVLCLALYFAVFGWAFSILNADTRRLHTDSRRCHCEHPLAFAKGESVLDLRKSALLFFLPCIWVALEYIRGHLFTGFSWALLGYSQYSVLPLIQISDITGSYGVSFLLVLVNVGVWQGINAISGFRSQKSEVRSQKDFTKCLLSSVFYPLSSILCLLCTVILVVSYGYFRLGHRPQGHKIKVAVVQGNIPQKMKWDPQARDYILEKYSHLTKKAWLKHPQIIIWPETAVPGYLADDPTLLKKISSLSKRISPTYLLVGTPQEGGGSKTYNSATLLLQGDIIQRYDKLHLVPFGEFIPWPGVFSRFSFAGLIGQFTPGQEHTVFRLCEKTRVKLSAVICFEDVFAHLTRRFVHKGAQILVNMTNDAWFEDSSEPYQHLQASVFRAVENRVNVVRSANTGVSCFINPWGEILSKVSDDSGGDVLIDGQAVEDLEIAYIPSFYTAFGDIFAWFCLVVALFVLGTRVRNRTLIRRRQPLP